jgi:hypothetical protein
MKDQFGSDPVDPKQAPRGGPFVAPDEKKRPADAHGFALAEGNWWGGSTHKGNTIYLHILRWPADTISLTAMPRKIVRHNLLGGGTATVKQSESGIQVSVPAARRHAIDTIVKLELDGAANTLPVLRQG